MKPLIEDPKEVTKTAARWVARSDRGLTEAEAAEFALWSREPDHAKAYQECLDQWSLLGKPKAAGKGAALLAKVSRIERTRRTKRVAVGGALAMVLLVGSLWWNFREAVPADGNSPRTVVILPRHATLPDGSTIEAPAGVEYTVDYSGHFRRVYLTRGEALFAVAKNSDQPFVVEAGGVDFRAVGTAFNVRLEAGKVALLVTEGKVAVDTSSARTPAEIPPTGLGLGKLAMATAGEEVVVDRHSMSVVLPVALAPKDVSEQLAWRNPRVEFSEAPLSEVIATMNKYNRVQFVIEDPVLARTKLSGLFPADDAVAFETMLKNGFGVEVVHEGNRALVRRAVAR